jgi:hypothetical protein
METKKALEILIQSVTIANKRGAFELAESKIIADAVEVFIKKDEQSTNTQNTEGSDTQPNKEGGLQETIESQESSS